MGAMLLLFVACAPDLPEDADGLFHTLWQAWVDDDDRLMASSVEALAALPPARGELSTLSDQELQEFTPQDP
jgi:hypothetical protein